MLRLASRIVSIRITVVFVFLLGILMTTSFAIILQYHFSTQIATDAATNHAANVARNTKEKVASLSRKATYAVELLARNTALVDGDQVGSIVDELFSNLLDNNNEFYAVYIGFANGDFYELINLEASPVIREQLGASLTDRYAKVSVKDVDGKRMIHTQFLTEKFTLSHQIESRSEYDATSRTWFRIANDIKASQTEPYLFHLTQAPGQTYSMVIEESDAVIGIDIALSTMSGFLTRQISNTRFQSGQGFLYKSDGTLIASNSGTKEEAEYQLSPLVLSQEERDYIDNLHVIRISNEVDWAPLDYSISGEPRGYAVEFTKLLTDSLGLNIEYVNGVSWSKLVDHYHEKHIEILAPVYRTEFNKDWGIFSEPLLDMPMALAVKEGATRYQSLSELNGKTLAIPAGWSIIPELKRAYPTIKILQVSNIFEALKAVLSGGADAAIESEITLNYNLDIFYLDGIKVLSNIDISPARFDSNLRYVFQPEYQPLAKLINKAIANVKPKDRQYLSDKWLSNSSELIETESNTVPYNALVQHVAKSDELGQLVRADLESGDSYFYIAPVFNGTNQYIGIVFNAEDILKNSRREVLISIGITALFILLLLPASWLFANPIVLPIRQLALENEKIMHRQHQDVKHNRSAIKEIDELSTSLVNMSKAIATHQKQQQDLMDAFVQLIAQAIDDKSPYTGGHCHRVPELGLMLAKYASQSEQPCFRDFSIEDEDKHREFRMAAWLHDCGKITTPEHVVDKGSKLETSYNRIHEIRTRFEVLWRDAEIDYLKAVHNQPEMEGQWLEIRNAKQQQLVEDFQFVAQHNIGSESMDDCHADRLTQIAQQTWQRHFDDRLGLSPVEEKRLTGSTQSLPVQEQLISDKSEHRIRWERKPHYDEDLKIKLKPTELQNNQGELYNLLIRRGTLNHEERFRIMEHTVSTIKILERLPFPKELENVPRYASTHHENLKGTGYPRNIPGDDLSVGERILVLADIFEALTADDRPYKKAKTLSTAIDILYYNVKQDNIDKDIFKLFLTSGVYLTYAKTYLADKQIDEVDVEKYLAEL